MKRLPRNWRTDQDLIDAYEEGGISIGRAIMYDADKEPYFWSLVGPLKLWPRWYLAGFRALYRDRNPTELRRMKRRLERAAKRKREEEQG